MVPSTPIVVTLPLTDRSVAIVIVPEPEADVVTAGTSYDPESETLIACAATDKDAKAREETKNFLRLESVIFISISCF